MLNLFNRLNLPLVLYSRIPFVSIKIDIVMANDGGFLHYSTHNNGLVQIIRMIFIFKN